MWRESPPYRGEQYLHGELSVRVPRSDWLQTLRSAGARNALRLEKRRIPATHFFRPTHRRTSPMLSSPPATPPCAPPADFFSPRHTTFPSHRASPLPLSARAGEMEPDSRRRGKGLDLCHGCVGHRRLLACTAKGRADLLPRHTPVLTHMLLANVPGCTGTNRPEPASPIPPHTFSVRHTVGNLPRSPLRRSAPPTAIPTPGHTRDEGAVRRSTELRIHGVDHVRPAANRRGRGNRRRSCRA